MDDKNFSVIKDLIEGYSRQSKVVNQFWVVLMIAAIWTLTSDKIYKTDGISLPFSLGKVNDVNFLIGCIMIICILFIAYSSTMIQSLRTRLLIQKIINSEETSGKYIAGIHIQDYVDSLITSTYGRVAPISQFMLGKHQFIGDRSKPNSIQKNIAKFFYWLLKICSLGITYCIPFYAIYNSWRCLVYDKQVPSTEYITNPLIIITVISGLILLVGELRNLSIVNRKFDN